MSWARHIDVICAGPARVANPPAACQNESVSTPRTLLILALIPLLAACGSTPEGPATVAPTQLGGEIAAVPDARLWWNAAGALGAPDAAQTPLVDGLTQLDRIFVVVMAMRRRARVDPAVGAIFSRIADNMDSTDLRGLHALIPAEPEADGAKTLRVLGRLNNVRYSIRLAEPGEPDMTELGDYVSRIALRPIEGRSAADFRLGMRSSVAVDLGQITPDQMGRFVAGILRWYEQGAGGRAGGVLAPPRSAPRQGEAFEPLDEADLSLLRVLAASFPATLPRVLPLIEIDDLAWLEARAGRRVTQVRIALRPNLQTFAKRFPLIHEYLITTKTMRESRFTVRDPQGRPLIRLTYDGPNLRLTLRAALLDGVFVPLEGPSLDGFDINRSGLQRLESSIDMTTRFWGMTFKLEDMVLPVAFRRSPDEISGEYRLQQLPRRIEVSGALFGVVPVWLVDLLIPSNLEQITRNFVKTLIQGDNGRGMQLAFRYLRRHQRNTYEVGFDAELANNGFVKIKAKLFKERFAPRKKARGEIGDLLSSTLSALRADLARFRERAASAAAVEGGARAGR